MSSPYSRHRDRTALDGAVTANLAVRRSRRLIDRELGPCEHPDFREAAGIEEQIQVLACRAPTRGMQPRDLVEAPHLGTYASPFLAIRLFHASLSQVVSATPRVRNSNFNTRIDV